MPRVLVVCAGNTCRSPLFAHALALVAPWLEVRSAMVPGKDTAPGRQSRFAIAAFEDVVRRAGEDPTATARAIEAMARHTSRRWTRMRDQAEGADLVVTFEAAHADAVRRALPRLDAGAVLDLGIRDKAHGTLQREGFPADPASEAGRVALAAYVKLAERLLAEARALAASDALTSTAARRA